MMKTGYGGVLLAVLLLLAPLSGAGVWELLQRRRFSSAEERIRSVIYSLETLPVERDAGRLVRILESPADAGGKLQVGHATGEDGYPCWKWWSVEYKDAATTASELQVVVELRQERKLLLQSPRVRLLLGPRALHPSLLARLGALMQSAGLRFETAPFGGD